MVMTVAVSAAGPHRPPNGARLVVEARDVTFEDDLAEVVARIVTEVGDESGDRLATVDLDISRRPDQSTIWAHVDLDGSGRVSEGDYITMESFPLPPDDRAVSVTVREVPPARPPSPSR